MVTCTVKHERGFEPHPWVASMLVPVKRRYCWRVPDGRRKDVRYIPSRVSMSISRQSEAVCACKRIDWRLADMGVSA